MLKSIGKHNKHSGQLSESARKCYTFAHLFAAAASSIMQARSLVYFTLCVGGESVRAPNKWGYCVVCEVLSNFYHTFLLDIVISSHDFLWILNNK